MTTELPVQAKNDSLAEFVKCVDVANDKTSSPDAIKRSKNRAMEIMLANGLREKAVVALGWEGMSKHDIDDIQANVSLHAFERLAVVDVHRDDYHDGRNDPIRHCIDIGIKKTQSSMRKETQRNITYICTQCCKSFTYSQYTNRLKKLARGILIERGHDEKWLKEDKKGQKLVRQEKRQFYNKCPVCTGKVVVENNCSTMSAFVDEDGNSVEFEADSHAIQKYRTQAAIVTPRDLAHKKEQLAHDRKELKHDIAAIKREYNLPPITCEVMDLIFKEQIMYRRMNLSEVKNREVRKRIQKTGKDYTDNYFLALMERFDKSNIQSILKHIDRIRDAVNSYYGNDIWSRMFNKPTTDEIFYIEYSKGKRSDSYIKIGTGKFIKIEGDFGLVEITYCEDYVRRHHPAEPKAVVEVERVEKFKKWVIIEVQI
jgi:hypothetical protein